MALYVVFVSGLTWAMARDELTETIFPQRGCWITPYLNFKIDPVSRVTMPKSLWRVGI